MTVHPPRTMRSALFVSGARALMALLTLGLGVVSASYFGTSIQKDCYLVAQTIPMLVATLLAGGLYGNLLVSLAEIGPAGAEAQRSFTWRALARLVAALVPVTLVASLVPRPLIAVLAPGFGPDAVDLSSDLLRVTLWSILARVAFTALRCPFETRSRFGVPSVANLVMTGVPLVFLLMATTRFGIFALAAGSLLGTALGGILLACMGPLILRDPPLFTPQSRGPRAEIATRRRFWISFLPLTVGAAFGQVNLLVDNAFASFLPVGSITLLGFATVVLSNSELLTALSLSELAFPRFAALSRDAPVAMAETLRAFSRYLLLATVPIAVGLLVFGRPLARLLFERGQFGPEATEGVASLLAIYSPKVIGVGWVALCVGVLMAHRRLRAILWIAVTIVAANAAADALLIGALGIRGIALATTLVVALQCALVWRAVRPLTGPVFTGADRAFALRVAGSGVSMGCVVFAWRVLIGSVIDTAPEGARIVEVVVGLALGAGSYIGFLLLLGVPQAGDLIREAFSSLRLSRRPGGGRADDLEATP